MKYSIKRYRPNKFIFLILSGFIYSQGYSGIHQMQSEYYKKHYSSLYSILNAKEPIEIANKIKEYYVNRKKYDFSLENAREMLRLVELESLSDRFPNEISGGERQRVAVLRGIINKPDIVFADEPTGNLDNDNSMIIIKLLND